MFTNYFAGFVCEYQFSELYIRYGMGLGIVLAASVFIYLFALKKIDKPVLRWLLVLILIIFVIVGGHSLYLYLIGGDFLGCGVFPWISHPI